MKKSLITFKVGTRSSKLAISQCETSLDKIKTLIDGINFELITFDTTGDNDQNLDLRQSPENFLLNRLMRLSMMALLIALFIVQKICQTIMTKVLIFFGFLGTNYLMM